MEQSSYIIKLSLCPIEVRRHHRYLNGNEMTKITLHEEEWERRHGWGDRIGDHGKALRKR